ncbi:hypothetical protein [Chitinophaga barathri]|uniref:Uncharacterized protein n=1 Tax=Chitinophaga barathri TaxID=1647451 RepID=A0A3N4MDG8_9BACT|nr:hypothetical protein [Chitinophaga barathri]RPD41475.1 hypothetical protein EG028_09145 [Chitinophaga barathri]
MLTPDYNEKVFINCPFDDGYRPILHAMVYAVYRCGFYPVTALAEDDGTDSRLNKILRCIRDCRYGIHDISCIEVNMNNLPRFNMPFETGLFFAAKHFGGGLQKTKSGLVFERTKYLYQQYISDLNGIDTKAHGNDPIQVLEKIRDWLRTSSNKTTIPGGATLRRDYRDFVTRLPSVVDKLGFDQDNILFSDFCQIVERAMHEKLEISLLTSACE